MKKNRLSDVFPAVREKQSPFLNDCFNDLHLWSEIKESSEKQNNSLWIIC